MTERMWKTLPEAFAAHAAREPDARFAADGRGICFSYGEAFARTRAAAGLLRRDYGVRRGDRVLVKCSQNVDYLMAILACGMLGAVYVPVEQNASADRLREIAADTDGVLLIADAPLADVSFASYAAIMEAPESEETFEFPAPDALSEILYTTGTTGKSKGIAMTHAADVALAENIREGVAMKPGNTELIPLAMSHSHGLRTFYAALLNGGSVVLSDGVMNVRGFFRLMEDYAVTALDLSPSAAQILIRLSKGAFWQKAKELDYIEIGTAALPEELKEQLSANLPGVRLWNAYGSTESGRVCILDFGAFGGKKHCIGRPSVNAEIVFTDEARKPIDATPEQPGLLASRGPMNMRGYWKNPELTADVLIDGFVCTNDIGYIDGDGFVYVVGRRDDVINYNGLKIAPGEIEEIAERYPGVAECACVGKADPVAGQIPWLYAAADPGAAFDTAAFTAYLQAHLDGSKMPKAVRLIEALPRTYNGKLDRRKLAARED